MITWHDQAILRGTVGQEQAKTKRQVARQDGKDHVNQDKKRRKIQRANTNTNKNQSIALFTGS